MTKHRLVGDGDRRGYLGDVAPLGKGLQWSYVPCSLARTLVHSSRRGASRSATSEAKRSWRSHTERFHWRSAKRSWPRGGDDRKPHRRLGDGRPDEATINRVATRSPHPSERSLRCVDDKSGGSAVVHPEPVGCARAPIILLVTTLAIGGCAKHGKAGSSSVASNGRDITSSHPSPCILCYSSRSDSNSKNGSHRYLPTATKRIRRMRGRAGYRQGQRALDRRRTVVRRHSRKVLQRPPNG